MRREVIRKVNSRSLFRRATVLFFLGPTMAAWTAFLAFAGSGESLWAFRGWLLRREFAFQHFGFQVRTGSQDVTRRAPLMRYFLMVALKELLLALIIAAMTVSLDGFLHRFMHSRTVPFVLPGIKPNYVSTALAATLQMSVVIIGLYMAAFSVVASTVYGRVYADIRELLFKEIQSNTFLRTMAFTGSYTGILLFAQVLGFTIRYFAIAMVLLALVFGIRTFVTVGIAVFRLFDPLNLLGQLRLDFADAIVNATTRGYRFEALSFQAAYRQRAESDLAALRHILQVADRDVDIAKVATFCVTVLTAYETFKRDIPSDSAWFRGRYQHTDWLTADYEDLSIALETRTRILPKEVREDNWFEVELSRTLVDALGRIQDHSVLHQFNHDFGIALQNVSFALAVPEAVAFANAVLPTFFDLLSRERDQSVDSTLLSMEIADAAAMSSTGILVGLLNRIDKITIDFIKRLTQQAYRNRPAARNSWLPKTAYDSLNTLRKGWQFERLIEGRTITPMTYAEQLIGRQILSAILSGIESAVAIFDSRLRPEIKLLEDKKKFTAALMICVRSYESTAKLAHSLEKLNTLTNGLRPSTTITGEPWLELNEEELAGSLDDMRRHVVTRMADDAIYSWSPAFDNKTPDLFGHAYHVVADSAFQAMLERDVLFARALGERYVLLAIAGIERLKGQLEGKAFFTWAGQLALDLCELCGYAIMFSALDSEDYWTAFRDSLDKSFKTGADFCKSVDAYVGLAQYSKGILAITPLRVLRVNWERALEERLETLGLRKGDRFAFDARRPRTTHKNPTVRALLRSWRTSEEAFNLFVSTYALRRCPDITSASDSAIELYKEILREHHR